MMGKAVHWPQIKGLDEEELDPAVSFGWDILVYMPSEYQTEAEAIAAALRIGYNLGLRAARGEDLTQLPQQKLPNPLYDSIIHGSGDDNDHREEA